MSKPSSHMMMQLMSQMAKDNKLLLPHWKPLVELEANVTLHCVSENVVHSSVTLVQCLH